MLALALEIILAYNSIRSSKSCSSDTIHTQNPQPDDQHINHTSPSRPHRAAPIMPEFNLQEEIQSLSDDPALYQIDHELDIPQLSTQAINRHLEEAIDQVTQSTECITLPEVFDVYRSLLKYVNRSRRACSVTSSFHLLPNSSTHPFSCSY